MPVNCTSSGKVRLAHLDDDELRRFVPVLVEAGEAASRRLGWSPEAQLLKGG